MLLGSLLLSTCWAAASAPHLVTLSGAKYIEVLTQKATAGESLPLVIALHPQGGDPQHFAEMFRGLCTKARVLLPYSDPKNGRFSWYRGNSGDKGATTVRRAANETAAQIEQLIAASPPSGRQVVTGFSQGAVVAFALAVMKPGLFSSVIPVAGRLAPDLFNRLPKSAPLPRVVAFHGEDDRVVPFSAGKSSIERMQRGGFVAKFRPYPHVGHTITEGEVADVLAEIDAALAGAK